MVDQKQEGQRLWLHLKNRPLDQDYRPHRPAVNEGPEAGYYWVVVTNSQVASQVESMGEGDGGRTCFGAEIVESPIGPFRNRF